MKVILPGGGVVQAYGLSGFISVVDHESADWGLYLDERWEGREVPWPRRLVRWPDWGLPIDELDAFDAFDEAFRRARAGELIDLACDGGTGRTGTALACIAVLAGVATSDVVSWVRHIYHPWAVEVEEQERLIARFDDWSRCHRPR